MTSEGAARAFRVAAADYMRWMDRAATEDAPIANLRELHRILGTLQAATADLPPVRLDGEPQSGSNAEAMESGGDLEEARAAWQLAATVASKLPLDAYCAVFDGLDAGDRVAIMKNLGEDLGDIYLDLQRAVTLFETAPLNEAIWKWRFDYYNHWGRHLVHAQTAIYSYLAGSGHFFENGRLVR